MIVPKFAGVIGLLTLPPVIMSTIIFLIVIAYAIGYIINRPIQIKTKLQEYGFLGLGAYVSGTSLTGAPLIVPVVASHVEKHELRNTLFVLWWILTLIKLVSFVVAGIDLQLVHHLWLSSLRLRRPSTWQPNAQLSHRTRDAHIFQSIGYCSGHCELNRTD